MQLYLFRASWVLPCLVLLAGCGANLKNDKKEPDEQQEKRAAEKAGGAKQEGATEPRFNVFYAFKLRNGASFGAVYAKGSQGIPGATSTGSTHSFSVKRPEVEVAFTFRFVSRQEDKDLWEVIRTVKAIRTVDAKAPINVVQEEPDRETKSVFFAGNDTVVFDDEYGTLSFHKEVQDDKSTKLIVGKWEALAGQNRVSLEFFKTGRLRLAGNPASLGFAFKFARILAEFRAKPELIPVSYTIIVNNKLEVESDWFNLLEALEGSDPMKSKDPKVREAAKRKVREVVQVQVDQNELIMTNDKGKSLTFKRVK